MSKEYDGLLDAYNVDEVIECLLPTDSTGRTVENELMRLAPNAYAGTGVPLKRVWPRLTQASRTYIRSCWQSEEFSQHATTMPNF